MREQARNDSTVDVVMRTRDRPLLLARALDDVLAQTHAEWRLLLVNDGGSAVEVDRLVAQRSDAFAGRVRVIHHDTSLGMEAAANAATRASDGSWVAVHDDDDTWHPDFLTRTVDWLRAHPGSPAVAVRTEIVWEEIRGSRVEETSREIFLPDLTQVTLAQLIRFNCCVPISLLYRRDDLERVGLFDETLEVVGDWECNVRLAIQGPFGFLPDRPLAFWRQRPGLDGVMGNSVITKRAEHQRADREVRDRELRRVLERDGAGLALYLTRYLDDRFDELHRRLDVVHARLDDLRADRERTLTSRVGGLARRVARRGLRRGRRS